MRFDVSSTALLSHLQSISKVIASKNTLPILDCFLFELKDGYLTIIASDVETRMLTGLPVLNAEGEGKFAVSQKILLEPLRELPEQPLNFEINDSNFEIFIHFQNGKYNFIGQDGSAYPEKKDPEGEITSFEMEASLLLEGINNTLFATGDDELRPVMNGINFDLYEDNITMVASDGHKLVKFTDKTLKTGLKSTFILPKKPATILRNLLPKEEGVIKLSFDDNTATFTAENFEMVCRLIEGRYPNYNSVIPKDNPNKIVIDRLSFLNAVKRISVFSDPAEALVRLALKENAVEISSQNIEFSTAAEEIVSCQVNSPEMNIGFKATYLIEILSNFVSQEISLELADPSRAGLILPGEVDEDQEILVLLMPMML